MPVFMPKPPPTSPTTTRTLACVRPGIRSANELRTPLGIWLLMRRVRRSPSLQASTLRGSIVTGARRWFTRSSATVCAAEANAAAARAASPCRISAQTLSGASGHSAGAPGAVARSTSLTAGRSS